MSVACSVQSERPTFTTVEIDGGRLILRGWAINKDGDVVSVNTYTTYPPNAIDDLNIIKSSYYTDINEQIDALPNMLRLNNKETVKKLVSECERAGTVLVGEYITSYNDLMSANEMLSGIPGDADQDNELSVSDALVCLRAAAGITEPLTDYANLYADMDSNGDLQAVHGGL